MSTSPSVTARYAAWLATNPPERTNFAFMSWTRAKWAEFRRENGLTSGFVNESIHAAFDAWLAGKQ